MSLSKLNDQLRAQICSFLPFKDINKIAQVNKSMKASLQRRGLDKLTAKRIRFGPKGFSDVMVVTMYFNTDLAVDETKRVKIDVNKNPADVFKFFNKFKSIDRLELYSVCLEDNVGWENIEAKIRSVELIRCSITMSKEKVMKFFKKIELVTLELCSYRVHTFITDELFTELARAGTTFHYKGYGNRIVAVTDATLDALSSRTIPNKLFLEALITGITFARMKKMMEDVLKTGMTEIEYDFGILKSDQYHAVRGFMFEEFEGWAEGFDPSLNFRRNIRFDDDNYYIYSGNRRLSIKFAVNIPDDLEASFDDEFGEQSDGEAESDEESDGEAESDEEEGPANA